MSTITNVSDSGITLAYNPAWTSQDATLTPDAWNAAVGGLLSLQPGDSAQIPSNFAAVLATLGGVTSGQLTIS